MVVYSLGTSLVTGWTIEKINEKYMTAGFFSFMIGQIKGTKLKKIF